MILKGDDMRKIIFMALAPLLIVACSNDGSRCWTDNAKNQVNSIVKNALADRIATAMGAAQAGNDKKTHEENVENISRRLTVKANNYAIDSVNTDSGKVACTCGVTVELSGGKKPFKSDGNIASYFVAKGEFGDVISAQLDIVNRVMSDFEK